MPATLHCYAHIISLPGLTDPWGRSKHVPSKRRDPIAPWRTSYPRRTESACIYFTVRSFWKSEFFTQLLSTDCKNSHKFLYLNTEDGFIYTLLPYSPIKIEFTLLKEMVCSKTLALHTNLLVFVCYSNMGEKNHISRTNGYIVTISYLKGITYYHCH